MRTSRFFVVATPVLLPARVGVGAFVPPATAVTCTPRDGIKHISSCRSSTRSWSRRSSLSASKTEAVANGVEEAKANVKRALAESGGSTLNEDVAAAVEVLAGFNPTPRVADAWPLQSGRWISIGEDFKGTTRTSDGVECTLGRLVFSIFEPVNLPVLITSIENILGARPAGAVPTEESLYKLVINFVARDASKLKGRVIIEGAVQEDLPNPQRMLVRFTKGFIEPNDGQDLESWCKVIGLRDAEDRRGNGPLSWLKRKAKGLLLKLAFGFRGPADRPGSRGELSYEMKRSPKGTLDVLFIDDEMRVTRGNQGAVVVVVRDSSVTA